MVFRQGDLIREMRAGREIVLSAGAIASPQLLELSGIGDAERLRDLGIEPVHHLPGVGENLQDHYVARICLKAKGIRTFNERSRGLPLAWEAVRYALTRKGLLTAAPGNVGASVRIMPGVATPDVQYSFAPASYKEGLLGVLDDYPGMTCGFWQHRPDSRGSIHIAANDPDRHPAIRPNYLQAPIDGRTMVGAMRLARRIFEQPAISSYIDRETVPGSGCADDDEMLDYCRKNGATVYHPVGTCRMGDDPMAVVDSALRLPRPGRAADRRRLGHAAHGVGEHQRRRADDRREDGRRHQIRGRRVRPAFAPIAPDCRRWLGTPATPSRPAPGLLLDRDGTLIVHVPYIRDPEQVRPVPGAAAKLAEARRSGWRTAIVTNQSGVARGYYGWEEFGAVQERTWELVGPVDAIYACPAPPGPVPLPQAGARHDPGGHTGPQSDPLPIGRGGDSAGDLAAGRAAGIARGWLMPNTHRPRDADRALALRAPDFEVSVGRPLSMLDVGFPDGRPTT